MCMIQDPFPGLDLYYTDPAQHLITADCDLDYLDRDLSDVCVCFLAGSRVSTAPPGREIATT